MEPWKRILKKVLHQGVARPDRTGIGTVSLFGEMLVFDNREDTFPAVTTKKLAFGPCMAELACFLRGDHTLKQFNEEGCRIWDANGTADYWKPLEPGDLGRIYGVQWRDWRSVGASGSDVDVYHTDQLQNLVQGLKKDPYGRRHLVTAWNPGELSQMCLPPCHTMWQCYVRPGDPRRGELVEDHFLDLMVSMRSVDLFLGLPFDVASYAVIQKLLCREVGMEPGWLVFSLADAHIYNNHFDQVNTVLAREEMAPPTLWLAPEAGLFNFRAYMADLRHYKSHPAVVAPMNP